MAGFRQNRRPKAGLLLLPLLLITGAFGRPSCCCARARAAGLMRNQGGVGARSQAVPSRRAAAAPGLICRLLQPHTQAMRLQKRPELRRQQQAVELRQ